MPPILETKFVATATDEGSFEGLASVFGTVDRVGDVVMPGAFKSTLDRLKASGSRLPLKYDHGIDIGFIEDAWEAADGLHVKGRLFLDIPEARTAHALMKASAGFMSFGYRVPEGARRQKNGHAELHDLDVLEITITSTPAHPDARVTSVKRYETAADLERALRQDLGLPGRAAKKLVAGGWSALAGDTEPDDAALSQVAERLTTITKSLRA